MSYSRRRPSLTDAFTWFIWYSRRDDCMEITTTMGKERESNHDAYGAVDTLNDNRRTSLAQLCEKNIYLEVLSRLWIVMQALTCAELTHECIWWVERVRLHLELLPSADGEQCDRFANAKCPGGGLSFRRWWPSKQTCWELINLMPECNLREFPFILLLRLFCLCMQNYFNIIFIVAIARVIGFNFICVRLRLEYRLYYCFFCSRLLLLLRMFAAIIIFIIANWTSRTYICCGFRKSIFCHMDSDWLLPKTKPICNQKSNHGTWQRIECQKKREKRNRKRVLHSQQHRITARTDSWIRRQYVDYFSLTSFFPPFASGQAFYIFFAALSRVQ